MSDPALKVLYRLKKEGYQAYLVGGCVRDLLLGREPKDFDVVTNARPEEIRATFRNCRLIGRRFRLAHVHFGSQIVEVATFRGLAQDDETGDRVLENGRILRDNVYGTIEEDAFRRDFTVNALYYNIADFSVVDYLGGMEDHKASTLKLIGEPEARYREDPVRMLRAIRFAVRLGFTLHPSCAGPIPQMAPLLRQIPAPRLYDEVMKLFLGGYAVQTFEALRHYRLFGALFPDTEFSLSREEQGFPLTFVAQALDRTDRRVQEGKDVAPHFLFAALLWEPVREHAENQIRDGANDIVAYQEAGADIVTKQIHQIAIPRSVSQPMRDIWALQPRFARLQGGRPFRLLTHPRFRAAYDFLVLRAESGEAEAALADWWTRFQDADEPEKKAMLREADRGNGRSKPRRRRHRPRKAVA
ncbi:polynucleotide adenylyltransferase PcnB [Methylolobus aquaticus]